MGTEYYLKFPISSSLYLEFRKQKALTGFNTNQFLYSLLSNVDPPIEFMDNYKMQFQDKKRLKFSQRLQKDTFLKFRLLSAYFNTHEKTIDYLLSYKKERGII